MVGDAPLRVVIADDHPTIRKGIRAILDRSEKIKVIGEASNGQEAVLLVETLSPDLLILDLQMPVMDGIQALKTLLGNGCPVAILILSAYDDPQYIAELLSLGASGYILKDDAPQSLLGAVQRMHQGEPAGLSPGAARKLRLV